MGAGASTQGAAPLADSDLSEPLFVPTNTNTLALPSAGASPPGVRLAVSAAVSSDLLCEFDHGPLGLRLEVGSQDGRLVVREVGPDSQASRLGVRANMVVAAVRGAAIAPGAWRRRCCHCATTAPTHSPRLASPSHSPRLALSGTTSRQFNDAVEKRPVEVLFAMRTSPGGVAPPPPTAAAAPQVLSVPGLTCTFRDGPIGVLLRVGAQDNRLVVHSVSAGMPAAHAGVQSNMYVAAVGGQPMRPGMNVDDFNSRVRMRPVDVSFALRTTAVDHGRQPMSRQMSSVLGGPLSMQITFGEGGLGIILRVGAQDGRLIVSDVAPNSQAARGGVRPNTVVSHVRGVAVAAGAHVDDFLELASRRPCTITFAERLHATAPAGGPTPGGAGGALLQANVFGGGASNALLDSIAVAHAEPLQSVVASRAGGAAASGEETVATFEQGGIGVVFSDDSDAGLLVDAVDDDSQGTRWRVERGMRLLAVNGNPLPEGITVAALGPLLAQRPVTATFAAAPAPDRGGVLLARPQADVAHDVVFNNGPIGVRLRPDPSNGSIEVVEVAPTGQAAGLGVEAGMHIVDVNGQVLPPGTSVDQFMFMIEERPADVSFGTSALAIGLHATAVHY